MSTNLWVAHYLMSLSEIEWKSLGLTVKSVLFYGTFLFLSLYVALDYYIKCVSCKFLGGRNWKSLFKKVFPITYMWSLKTSSNELIYKTETDSQIWKIYLWLPKGDGRGRGINWEYVINRCTLLLLLLLSHFSRVRLCATPETAAHQAPPSLGFSRQEHWSGLPFPSPMHESEKWKWSRSVVSDPQWPHGLQPTRLLHPWDFPGKSTGVGCHCLLQDAHYHI